MNRIGLFLLCVIVLLSFSCSHEQEPVFSDTIISIEQWGGERFTGEYPLHELKYITLHHGGVHFSDDADPEEFLRNLQAWCRTDREWIDIPYHYLISPDGTIYEGRYINYAGDTNTDYDPTGHALVCLIGNYEETEPNEKQIQAVVDLFS